MDRVAIVPVAFEPLRDGRKLLRRNLGLIEFASLDLPFAQVAQFVEPSLIPVCDTKILERRTPCLAARSDLLPDARHLLRLR